MKRKDGFYWVSLMDEWCIAMWDEDHWKLPGEE
jgi:hypothetical protein